MGAVEQHDGGQAARSMCGVNRAFKAILDQLG